MIELHKYLVDMDFYKNNLDMKNVVNVVETEFKKYIDVEYSVSVSSGSEAIHLALCALDLKRGDKVICSVNSHPSIAAYVRHFDAEPIFVDVDDNNHLDLDKVEQILKNNKSKKLRGIIASHIYNIVDIDRLVEFKNKYKIFVIEDALHMMGAEYKGKKIGSFDTDITIFSLNPFGSSSLSNGGFLVTNNKYFYEKALELRNLGIKFNEKASFAYDVVDIGCKYEMDTLQAVYALGISKSLDEDLERKKEISDFYQKELDGMKFLKIPKRYEKSQIFVIDVLKNRDILAHKLIESGIEVAIHYMPLHMTSYYKNKYNFKIRDFMNALNMYQKILSIPLNPEMTNEDIEYVVKVIRDNIN